MSDTPLLPPPVRAMLAQVAGMRSQLDALALSIEALGYGMQASAARQQQAATRTARDTDGMGPVFGAPVAVAPPVPDSDLLIAARTDSALARLDSSPSREAAP